MHRKTIPSIVGYMQTAMSQFSASERQTRVVHGRMWSELLRKEQNGKQFQEMLRLFPIIEK